RGADPRRLAVGGPERRGALAPRGLAAHLGHARRPRRDRRGVDGARGRRPGARHPGVGQGGRATSRSSASLMALAVGGVAAALLAVYLGGGHLSLSLPWDRQANTGFKRKQGTTAHPLAPSSPPAPPPPV